MNCSSFYSSTDTSEWDPKLLRQCLFITEDQLKKLNSLPGWSKVEEGIDDLQKEPESIILNTQGTALESHFSQSKITANETALRKESESNILNPQVLESELQIANSETKGKEYCNGKNIELFKEKLKHQRQIFQTNRYCRNKRRNSFSFIESSNKVISDESCLKHALSTSDINVYFTDLYPNKTTEFSDSIRVVSPSALSGGFQNKSKDIFSDTISENSSYRNKFTRAEYKNYKSLPCSVKHNSEIMEVITQFPVTVSCVQKDATDGIAFEIQEKQEILPNTNATLENLRNAHNNDDIDEGTKDKGVSDHSNAVNVPVSVQSCPVTDNEIELDSCIKPTAPENNAVKDDVECQKETTNSKILKESVDVTKVFIGEHALSQEKIMHENSIGCQHETTNDELLKKHIEVPKVSTEECVFTQVHSTYNPPNTYENCNTHASQKSQGDIGISCDKSAVVDNFVAVKRKSESRKSSKKQKGTKEAKIGEQKRRSVKKAGNITYSIEEIETMLNILKPFL